MLEREYLSLYLHIPFCRSRCNYCDFNTYAGMESYLRDYLEALTKELHLASTIVGEAFMVHSIYFGGGTPTLLPADAFEMILGDVRKSYTVADDVEITTEANPVCLPADYLARLKNCGINRLSMGMQSADEAELKLLGRRHTMDDVAQSVENARQAGIAQINLDLMFGIPGQPLDAFQQSIAKALAFSPQHLSVYSLTVEEGTPLERMLRRAACLPLMKTPARICTSGSWKRCRRGASTNTKYPTGRRAQVFAAATTCNTGIIALIWDLVLVRIVISIISAGRMWQPFRVT
jgi:putative oxygen-independent coproporphyrinogen III oxidase